MAVHIRLARAGAKKKPFYRVVVTDHRSPRGGRFLENIGTYDPSTDPGTLSVKHERLDFWRARGATPSDTLSRLLKRVARTEPAAEAAAAPVAAKAAKPAKGTAKPVEGAPAAETAKPKKAKAEKK